MSNVVSSLSLSLNQAAILRKIKFRIIPIAFILYFFNGLDRANLSYAALGMNKALAISTVTFGTITSMFFVGYLLFQIPSNILIQKVGANKLIPTIVIVWGIFTSLMFFVGAASHVMGLRFLIGVAEAGFFPGMIFYFTLWFPARERAQITALFFLSGPISGLVAAPISGWIVQNAHWLGHEGWRWLFVVEGIPTILLGALAYFTVKDGPQFVKWLTKDECTWLTNELQSERDAIGKVEKLSFKNVVSSGLLWRLAMIYMFVQAANQALMMWLPSLIKEFHSNLDTVHVGYLMMIPNVIAIFALPLWGTHSDNTGERKWHVAIPFLVIGISMISFLLAGNFVILIISLVILGLGEYSYFGTYWTLPPKLLSPAVLAVGIALINSCSSFGGFMGNYVVGFADKYGGTNGVFAYMTILAFASFFLLITMKISKDPTKKEQAEAAQAAADALAK